MVAKKIHEVDKTAQRKKPPRASGYEMWPSMSTHVMNNGISIENSN